ncbi:MAG: zf-HC2 domain-containing protein [Deltaproteobacteria bacterium]|nr:zf-HC2 domain-containing protein [Deltaproteobacteria bacterium]
MAEPVHTLHLLSAYLEGELLLATRQAVQNHLKTCEGCRQELRCLRQTVAMLQRLPLETAPADFLAKLKQRIERREVGARPGEEQGSVKPPLTALAQWVCGLGRCLLFPLHTRMPIYAGLGILLALAMLLSRTVLDKVTAAPAPPVLLSPALSAPASPQAASVTNEIVQARTTAASMPEQLPLPVVSVPSTTEERLNTVRTLRWRVAGSDPTVLCQQVKALVAQRPGAVIVQEEERLLVIALETQDLLALQQELGKLGEPSSPETPPETDIAPDDTRTTLLQVEFVRTSSVASPPIEQDLAIEG